MHDVTLTPRSTVFLKKLMFNYLVKKLPRLMSSREQQSSALYHILNQKNPTLILTSYFIKSILILSYYLLLGYTIGTFHTLVILQFCMQLLCAMF